MLRDKSVDNCEVVLLSTAILTIVFTGYHQSFRRRFVKISQSRRRPYLDSRATFWLNALTSAITFIIRHLSKTGDIPRQVDMKLGCQLKGFKEQAVLLIMIVASVPQFHVYLLYLGAPI